MKRLTADELNKLHGYCTGAKREILSNGRVGYCKEKSVLVVCCANCGDYSHFHITAKSLK